MSIVNYIKIAGVVGIILLVFLSYSLYKNNRELKESLEVEKNNTQQLVNDVKDKILNITLEQVKDNQKIDSLLKVVNIKPKQVTQITNITNTYIDSSKTITNLTEKNDSTFLFSYKDNCFSLQGSVNPIRKTLSFTEKTFNNETSIMDYWVRKKFLGLKIGRKEYFRKSINKCGESNTVQYNFQKK